MAAEGRSGRFATIRVRTTLAATIVVAAALVLAGVLTVVVLRRTLVDNIDDAVSRRADEIAHLVLQGAVPGTLASSGEDATTVAQVLGPDGSVTAQTENLRGVMLPPEERRSGGPRTVTGLPVPDESKDDFRVVVRHVAVESRSTTVIAAESVESVFESIAAVRRFLTFGLPIVVVLVGVTSWVVVGHSLRPVDAMRRQVADISAYDLSRRIPDPGSNDEIGRLAETMNAMLDRLESFTERQRRFVEDASHELQSPLAASLADLELARADPEHAAWEETAARLAADAQRMTKLVQDLLFLARSEGDRAQTPERLIDLDDVVRSEVSRLGARSTIAVDTTRVEPIEVRGDADQLARVLRNLLDNAARYAQSRISVELRANGDTATMVVADDGPGVPPRLGDRVFERFTRADDSRSRETGGSGLGLSIVREIVERHGGSIGLESNGTGARFVVRIPTPAPA